MKSRQKHRPRLGDAISVAIAKENDSILAWSRPSGLPLENPEEEALDSFPIVGPLRRVRFRHKYVAVRQDVNPSRMIQAAREGVDRESIRCHRRRITCPGLRCDDVYDGDQRFLGRRQYRVEPRPRPNRKSSRPGARCRRKARHQAHTPSHEIIPHRHLIEARITRVTATRFRSYDSALRMTASAR